MSPRYRENAYREDAYRTQQFAPVNRGYRENAYRENAYREDAYRTQQFAPVNAGARTAPTPRRNYRADNANRAAYAASTPSRNYRAAGKVSMPKRKNTSMTKRLTLDALLTVFIVFEMFIQYTGVFFHEIVGFVFLASIVVHLVIERKWIASTVSSLGQGKVKGKRRALFVIAVLLFASMAALMASSIVISTVLAGLGLNLTALNPGGIWYTVHTVSSYVLCGFTVAHLAMHWSLVASALKIDLPYDPSRRAAIGRGVGAVASLGIVALGVASAGPVSAAVAATGATGASGTAGATDATDAAASDSTAFADGSASDVPSAASGEGSAAAPSSASSSPAGSTGSSTSASASSGGASAGSTSSSSTAASTTVTSPQPVATAVGNCTICHKNCPLSQPQCNKPYAAGLIV